MISTEENKENEDPQDIEFCQTFPSTKGNPKLLINEFIRTTKSAAFTKNIIGCARKTGRCLTIANHVQ
jgi:hypothetical protein